MKQVLVNFKMFRGAPILWMNKRGIQVDCSSSRCIDSTGLARPNDHYKSCRRVGLASPTPLGDRCIDWMGNEVQE